MREKNWNGSFQKLKSVEIDDSYRFSASFGGPVKKKTGKAVFSHRVKKKKLCNEESFTLSMLFQATE